MQKKKPKKKKKKQSVQTNTQQDDKYDKIFGPSGLDRPGLGGYHPKPGDIW